MIPLWATVTVFTKKYHSYVGEVGIWTGIWVLSTTSLETSYFPFGTAIAAAVSPLFTWYLLRKASQYTHSKF